MIIGHYDSEMWSKGGVASYIRRVGRAQQAAGHQVYYFSLHPSSNWVSEAEAPIVVADNAALYTQARKLGLDILHVHKGLSLAPPNDIATIRTLHGHQPYCPSGSKFLERWNCPCDRPYSSYGCLWGHLVDRCGSIRPQNLQFNFRYTRDEIATLSKIPIITVSQFLKDQLIRSGYPECNIHVLHLFSPEVANTTSPPKTGVPHFVFLGRISAHKGVKWLLNTLKQITIPIHLDIAGDGPQETEMQELAQKLGLGDRVTFHGWLNSEQVSHLIRASRALIFPSIWHEPGGTVAFEAMANSRPVIMSQVGGMSEVVFQGVNGLLVEPNNIKELANCIEQLATDWSLAKKLGDEGCRLATEQFTLQKHLHQLMQFYQQAIEHRSISSLGESLIGG